MEEPKKRLPISLSDEERRRIRLAAARAEISMSEFIRRAALDATDRSEQAERSKQ